MTATAVAGVTGVSAYWIGQMARRYNSERPDSGRTVVAWCGTQLRRILSRQTGWRYLRRFGAHGARRAAVRCLSPSYSARLQLGEDLRSFYNGAVRQGMSHSST
jgi:hypothetical protein